MKQNIDLAFFHAVIMPIVLTFTMFFISRNNVVFVPMSYLAFMSAIYSIRAKLIPCESYIQRSNEFFLFVGLGLKLIVVVALAAIILIVTK